MRIRLLPRRDCDRIVKVMRDTRETKEALLTKKS